MKSKRLILVMVSLLMCLASYSTTVEEMPQFPGGDKALIEFIKNELKYPPEAMKNGEQGRVVVQFTVDTLGNVVNPKVLKSVSPSLDREALRIVSKMPKWTPGKLAGKVVNVKYCIPVIFRLTDPVPPVTFALTD